MKSGKYTENSIKFYIIGLLFVLVGLVPVSYTHLPCRNTKCPICETPLCGSES